MRIRLAEWWWIYIGVYMWITDRCSEKSPVDEDEDDESQTCKGRVLLDEQLPVDADGGAAVLLAVVAQAGAQLAHAFKTVATIQQILDVLGHNLGNITQLIVDLVEVLGSTGVGVGGLALGNEVVELHEGVGPQRRRVDLGDRVGGGELAGEVGEVGEGELARVRRGAYGEEDDVLVDQVVQGVGARLDACLRLGVAGELAEDLADVLLGFDEGGLGLQRRSGLSANSDKGGWW